MHPVKTLSLWLAVLVCGAFQYPGHADADVIVLDDGQQIETPRAMVEGSTVFYYKDEQVHTLPHARVREIQRGEPQRVSADEDAAEVANRYYRLKLTDGRDLKIGDYTDSGETIQYSKYGVRVTMEKSLIRTITRVSEKGEQVVFRHGERVQSLPVDRRQEGDAALRRMSEESRDRARYNAVVDNQAMAAEISRGQQETNKRCLDQCLTTMLSCRNKCAEVLTSLTHKQVPVDDPVYVMVQKEVVTPCIRQCIDVETACRSDCTKAVAPPRP